MDCANCGYEISGIIKFCIVCDAPLCEECAEETSDLCSVCAEIWETEMDLADYLEE